MLTSVHSEVRPHSLVSWTPDREKNKDLLTLRALSRCFLKIAKAASLYSWSAVKYSLSADTAAADVEGGKEGIVMQTSQE